MLNEVRKLNGKLERFLEKNDKVAIYRRSPTTAISKKEERSLVQYWRHADKIYALIHQSWGCQCKNQHCAYLWLQHRTARTFELRLLVLWAPQTVPGSAILPWDRQGLQIKWFEGSLPQKKIKDVSKPHAGPHQSILKQRQLLPGASTTLDNGKRRRIRCVPAQLIMMCHCYATETLVDLLHGSPRRRPYLHRPQLPHLHLV